jgi:outer membrane protein OmpA-like peptidoglycan-associated protein
MEKQMKKIIALLALTFLTQAFSYDLSQKFGLGGSIGLPIPVFGNNFNSAADAEWSGAVYGRYHFGPAYGMDLGVSKEGFKDTNMTFENINLLGFWRTAGAADITPVLGLGVGMTRIKNYSPASGKLSLLGRFGFEFAMMPSLSLGALVDYQYVSKIMGEMPSNPAHVLNPQLAFTWYFGADEKKEEPVPVTPPEKVVQAETDTVSLADSSTSREEMKPELTVEFDTAKSTIRPEYIAKIKMVAEQLKGDSSLTGLIEGYADNTGPNELNDKLSLQRANAVRKKLIEYGVDEKRVTAEGFGEDRPIAANDTAEGRQQNRRASVYISVIKSNISGRM